MGQFKHGDKVYFKGQEVEIRKVITNHATQQTLYELDTWDIVEGGLLSRVKPEKEEPVIVDETVVEPEKTSELLNKSAQQGSTDFNKLAESISSVSKSKKKKNRK